MKLTIVDLEKKKAGEKELPSQFNEEIRPDLIKRAVLTLQSSNRQKYGTDPRAGKKASALLSKRRRKYRGMYGHGISRTPRKIMSRRGTQLNWEGAFAPNTVGGRQAHPPKAEKNWERKINKKERRKAIRSAMAATLIKDLVKERGHWVPEDYPFIIDSKVEDLDKTKKVKDLLGKLGFEKELERGTKKKVRAGKGKLRGRKYKKKTSILIVVSKDCKLLRAGKNIPGIDIIKVNELNAEKLAPGAAAGRATLWSADSIEKLNKDKLFM
ncbi:50S ribosomal protein L4 [Candidatus Woesearchaeota archaeon]|nr:50S ribosomal protein L4 [Candidatus Woesearchaeota archaeon]